MATFSSLSRYTPSAGSGKNRLPSEPASTAELSWYADKTPSGAPKHPAVLRLLGLYCTPDEADFLSRMPAQFCSASQLSKLYKAELPSITEILERLIDKFLVADMGDRPEAERLAQESVERLGKVDILVSNAGWNVPQAAEAIRDEDWDALMELNVTSSMVLTRALSPGMMERGWGRILYTSSIMALGSTPERVAYSTTKAALLGMVKANALRMGSHGVTVNALAPGPFATPRLARLARGWSSNSNVARVGHNRATRLGAEQQPVLSVS